MATEKRLIDLWSVNMNEVDTSDCTDVEDILSAVVTYLSELPTVDAVEVVHGRWVKTENGIRQNINTGEMVMAYMHDCSVCGWHTGNQGRNFNYCPNCGAKMDGGKDNG